MKFTLWIKLNNSIPFIIVIISLILSAFSYKHLEDTTVKAVYIERFTRFIEWPLEIDISNTSEPFVIALIGETKLEGVLKQIYSKQKIKNKKVKIRHISNISEISKSHILIISDTKKKQLPDIIKYIENKPILTISDAENFAEKGVHINLYIEDERIRFKINQKALIQSGLKMSLLLYNSAVIINPTKQQDVNIE